MKWALLLVLVLAISPISLTEAGNGIGDCPSPQQWWPDADGDGFGDSSAEPTELCDHPGDGWSDNNADCDDSDPTVYPGAPEICDGKDTSCSGLIDCQDPECIDCEKGCSSFCGQLDPVFDDRFESILITQFEQRSRPGPYGSCLA